MTMLIMSRDELLAAGVPDASLRADTARALVYPADELVPRPTVVVEMADPCPELDRLNNRAAVLCVGRAATDRTALRELIHSLRARATSIERWLDETPEEGR
ncbi:MAG: hypothetical protein M5U09_13640 [Gammaproteobacteria bacterium]|nr:hypothetical protein [Gammaproteobacteria bacterium]